MTALLLVPLGLLLYFLPEGTARLAGVSPLWLARVSGGLLLAWGAFQLFASARPDAAKVGGLVAGNLLTVAALLPALLRLQATLSPTLTLLLWGMTAWLGLAALLALFAVPLGHRASAARQGGEADVR